MSNALGIIFSNIHDKHNPELTKERTVASIPFACRYRLIDFALSNMVNAGIVNVGIIANKHYQSLINHVGSGKDWDLARKNGGLVIIPPFSDRSYDSLYHNRLEALKSAQVYISNATEEYVILSDCDAASNIPLADVLAKHIEENADITCVYRRQTVGDAPETVFTLNNKGKITDIGVYTNMPGQRNVSINITVMKRSLLLTFISDAIAHGYSSMSRDILAPNLDSYKIMAYKFDGYYAQINSLESYYREDMRLLDKDVRDSLFGNDERPVYTRIKDSFSTKYGDDAKVVNSMIADGCIIEGTVENCILHRCVKVGKGAVVKNSIIMRDTIISDNANLNCIVSDRNVVVKDGRNLSGCEDLPFYIAKGKMI